MTENSSEMTPEREHVIAYMHSRGSHANLMTDAHYDEIYAMADGFGPVGEAIFEMIPDGDWSHVRDSSAEAFKAMSSRLRELGYDWEFPEGPTGPGGM